MLHAIAILKCSTVRLPVEVRFDGNQIFKVTFCLAVYKRNTPFQFEVTVCGRQIQFHKGFWPAIYSIFTDFSNFPKIINHIITCAAVKLFTESVLEINPRVWECQFNKPISAANESTIRDEVEIALNSYCTSATDILTSVTSTTGATMGIYRAAGQPKRKNN